MTEETSINLEKQYQNKFCDWGRDTFLNNSCVNYANIPWFIRCTNRALDSVFDKKPLVIGICGNAGTGKDSSTEFLLRYPQFRCTKMALADPIREIGRIFGFTVQQMTDRRLKEELDDFWKVSPRYFMQRVGTEMFRKQWRDDVWIELAHKRINKLSLPYDVKTGDGPVESKVRNIIFISDVRFPNEAEFIKSIGGHIIKVVRPTFTKKAEETSHDSEKFVSSIESDLIMLNNYDSPEAWTWAFTVNLMRYLTNKNFYDGMADRGKLEESGYVALR